MFRVGERILLPPFCPCHRFFTFHVHSLAAGEAIAEIQGSSDGDHLRGKWKIPKGVSATELYFTVRHEGARAKSSMLVID